MTINQLQRLRGNRERTVCSYQKVRSSYSSSRAGCCLVVGLLWLAEFVSRSSLVSLLLGFFSPSPEPLAKDVEDAQASADAGRLLRPLDRHPQPPASRWKHFRSQGLRLRRLYGTIALFQCTAAIHCWSVALFLYCIVALLHLEVERAQIFRARDELKL